MKSVSRRSILAASAAGAGLAAIPFPVWFERQASAQTTLTRFNAASAEGQAMTTKYAAAVQTMMGTKATDPLSWVWQWYTHWTPSPGKSAEILRLFGPSGNTLAQQMWNTCQPHGGGMNPDNFLPWHRMYVYFFERIVRKLTGDATWTLPYWDYTDPARQALPDAFYKPGGATNPLYRPNRNPGVNDGTAITVGNGGPGALNLNSMKQTNYSGATGFCNALDGGLHGNVHVFTGNTQGMGSVPTAAGDPVFWFHHCNIDRVWASWNKEGNKNPTDSTWQAQTFVFVDENGQRVVATIKDFLDIAPLGYTYKEFLSTPKSAPAAAAAVASAAGATAATLRVASVPQPVALTGKPVSLPLQQAPAAAAAGALASRSGQTYLRIGGLKADEQPGVAYNVFLDLPAGQPPTADSPHYVGTVNFFGVIAHTDGDSHGSHGAEGDTRLLNVTDTLAELARRNLLSDTPTVQIVPTGEPQAKANATLASVSLVG